MKAVRFYQTGGSEVLVYEEMPPPSPKAGEVLIRIEAVGLNFAFPDLIQSTLGEIIGYIIAGKLSLQVGTLLPLSQAAEAHHLLERRKTTGKVVLLPWPEGQAK